MKKLANSRWAEILTGVRVVNASDPGVASRSQPVALSGGRRCVYGLFWVVSLATYVVTLGGLLWQTVRFWHGEIHAPVTEFILATQRIGGESILKSLESSPLVYVAYFLSGTLEWLFYAVAAVHAIAAISHFILAKISQQAN